MKKILTAVMALIITTGIVQAQDQSKTTAKTPATQTAATKCDMKNCCMMKAGKMICMKDGKEVAMNEDMTMKNGTVVHADGTLMTKDGKKLKMKDGECIDMNGTMARMQQSHTVSSSDKAAQPAVAQPASTDQKK